MQCVNEVNIIVFSVSQYDIRINLKLIYDGFCIIIRPSHRLRHMKKVKDENWFQINCVAKNISVRKILYLILYLILVGSSVSQIIIHAKLYQQGKVGDGEGELYESAKSWLEFFLRNPL